MATFSSDPALPPLNCEQRQSSLVDETFEVLQAPNYWNSKKSKLKMSPVRQINIAIIGTQFSGPFPPPSLPLDLHSSHL